MRSLILLLLPFLVAFSVAFPTEPQNSDDIIPYVIADTSKITEELGIKFEFSGEIGQQQLREQHNESNEQKPPPAPIGKAQKMKSNPKQKQQKKNSSSSGTNGGGLLKKIGALTLLLPLAVTGAAGFSTPINSSSTHNLNKTINGLHNPNYGGIVNPFIVYDDNLNSEWMASTSADDKEENPLKETNFEANSQSDGVIREQINVLKEEWQNNSKAKINFEKVFKQYNAATEEQKLSLLKELSQRSNESAKCRCNDQMPLNAFGSVEKIGNSFVSVNRSNFLREGDYVKNFFANSEHYEQCVTMVEIDLHVAFKEWIKREMKILKMLNAAGAKRTLRLFEIEQNESKIKMISDNRLINVEEAWHKIPAEEAKTLLFVKVFFQQMLVALTDFHKFGMHLSIDLSKFFFVKDLEEFDFSELSFYVRLDRKLIRAKAVIDNFGSAKLFSEKFPKNEVNDINQSTHFGDQRRPLIRSCPEQITGAFDITPKCDIYSLGIVLFEMLVPQMGNPFDFVCQPNVEAGKEVYNACVKDVIPKLTMFALESEEKSEEEPYRQIVMACMQSDPKNRPTAQGIQNFLRGKCVFSASKINAMNDVPLPKCETD